LGQLADKNDRLWAKSARAREGCAQEREHAWIAGEVASAMEGMCNGLLSNCTQLTKKNVKFQCAVAETVMEDDGVVAELKACWGELDCLQKTLHQTNKELRHRAAEIVDLQRATADERAENNGLVKELCLQDTCKWPNKELQRMASELPNVWGEDGQPPQ
jgi:hypothetical protein